ncbi:heavy-metal-associated domain-containing protein [Flavobacterium sp.]|jgi:copper chaperone CopZ|uniref:heavy-metal-associated domain-containing protein n=1 Tax=Flavobacterium sp. TaxID=239 RepID=UPI0025F7BC1B|nr:heavy-metal-associated domain-containing protein [Flavobacterium sp.]
MKTEEIKIANLKCGGCATTIKKELLELDGVNEVKVDNDNDSVTVTYKDEVRSRIIDKLHQLGYPEATEKNGLLLKLKSYSSCMIGKINNL